MISTLLWDAYYSSSFIFPSFDFGLTDVRYEENNCGELKRRTDAW